MSMIECLSHQCMRVNVLTMQISIEDFDYLLKSARSVRRKLDFDRPISREDIEACIDVAVQAPTGIAGENWRFLVVTEPKRFLVIFHCRSLRFPPWAPAP